MLVAAATRSQPLDVGNRIGLLLGDVVSFSVPEQAVAAATATRSWPGCGSR
jgi:hypothetical protein